MVFSNTNGKQTLYGETFLLLGVNTELCSIEFYA